MRPLQGLITTAIMNTLAVRAKMDAAIMGKYYLCVVKIVSLSLLKPLNLNVFPDEIIDVGRWF